jgi:uridine kinase
MSRGDVIDRLAAMIAAIRLEHPVRVGIDGVDCAGKTVLADELVAPLLSQGRPVIRASVDGFHHPRAIRHRRGRTSPVGYYEDSFDHAATLSCILLPLGPAGDLRFRPAAFDFRTDSPVDRPWQTAAPDAVLVFEGIFLHRPELLPHWDFSVFIEASFDVTVQRAFLRDRGLFETRDKTQEIYEERYIPGQKLYLSTQRPREKADVIVDNNDLENPVLIVNKRRELAAEETV